MMNVGKLTAKVAKVDGELGIVFGFGITTYKRVQDPKTKKMALQPYFDLQDEHIPDRLMLSAVSEFQKAGAPVDAMHDEVPVGKVLFSFPLTRELAKSMGIHDADEYGWMVGVVPGSPEILAKYKSGEWTGFSIGGWASAKAYVDGTCTECGKPEAACTCDDEAGESDKRDPKETC